MIELYIQKYLFTHEKKDVGHDVAYSLLERLCNEKIGTYQVKIEKDENEKPYFPEDIDGVKYYFSISHSNGYAAVLLTDLCECGVDIEPQMTKERAKRVNDRFLSDDFEIDKYDGEIIPTLIGFNDDVSISFDLDSDETSKFATEKWTTLEALLKADGRGFTAFSQRHNIVKQMCTGALRLIDGDKNVYVALALKDKAVTN